MLGVSEEIELRLELEMGEAGRIVALASTGVVGDGLVGIA